MVEGGNLLGDVVEALEVPALFWWMFRCMR
jgi:hypothetical protein